jgi:predicted phosphodiesterase
MGAVAALTALGGGCLDRSHQALGELLAYRAPIAPRRVDPPFEPRALARVRLGFVGDTGATKGPGGVVVDRIREAMRAARPDFVFGLGDLVYEAGPLCPSGAAEGEPLTILEGTVGRAYLGLDAPAFLVLGNHDVGQASRDTRREACYLDYAAREPSLVMPARSYVVELGVATVAVLDTNHLDDEQAKRVTRAFASAQGYRVLVGHHVLRVFHDHDSPFDDGLEEWMRDHDIVPDLHVAGHAHLQQVGVYGGILSVTTGSGSKLRHRPSCSPSEPDDCGPGQLFGASEHGFVTVDLDARELRLTVRDDRGRELYEQAVARE